MPKLIAIATEDAPLKVDQDEVKDFVRQMFSGRRSDIERLLNVFGNTSVRTRHFTEAKSWYGEEHGFAERNEIYISRAVEMSELSVKKCLDMTGMKPSDINHVFFISSTGISTPSIDARLYNVLGLSQHVRRTPIWGIGCAGGAVGLSRALEYTTAKPNDSALVIAIELCGLTFQKDDVSKSNLVGTSLFSDGAAAAIVVGDDHGMHSHSGVELLNSLSTIYDDSLDVMGWDVLDSGLRVVFSKDIPTIVRDSVRQNVEEIASQNGLKLTDINHYVVHPGGQKVLDAYEESLGLENNELRFSRKVLREHGNMSSPTVLYVLKEFMSDHHYAPGDYGLISALGPGFSSELIMFMTD